MRETLKSRPDFWANSSEEESGVWVKLEGLSNRKSPLIGRSASVAGEGTGCKK